MDNYGLILKQLRQLNGDSLKSAARKIGKSVGWLSEVENGRGLSRLKQDEFERIVLLFGGDKHRELFKTWVAVEKIKDKADRTLDGAVLKHIREKRELSLFQAAQKIGISSKYLSNLEIGRRPTSLAMRDRIMRAYALDKIYMFAKRAAVEQPKTAGCKAAMSPVSEKMNFTSSIGSLGSSRSKVVASNN